MRLFLTLLFALFLVSSPALAGGSWEPVHVQKLTMLSDTDYILVVLPVPDNNPYWKDPWLGNCQRFEVHGTLQRLEGTHWFTWWVTGGAPTKEQHLAALARIKKFEGSKSVLNFGWMGTGFNIIDPKNPCIVESRGLDLVIDGGEDGKTAAIVSYFHST
jgi:hypothetical protein